MENNGCLVRGTGIAKKVNWPANVQPLGLETLSRRVISLVGAQGYELHCCGSLLLRRAQQCGWLSERKRP